MEDTYNKVINACAPKQENSYETWPNLLLSIKFTQYKNKVTQTCKSTNACINFLPLSKLTMNNNI